ncbi:hypothetical protein CONLIGDRAFT_693923, partial [Coniochaeta ligniaria NRRL 30616]
AIQPTYHSHRTTLPLQPKARGTYVSTPPPSTASTIPYTLQSESYPDSLPLAYHHLIRTPPPSLLITTSNFTTPLTPAKCPRRGHLVQTAQKHKTRSYHKEPAERHDQPTSGWPLRTGRMLRCSYQARGTARPDGEGGTRRITSHRDDEKGEIWPCLVHLGSLGRLGKS